MAGGVLVSRPEPSDNLWVVTHANGVSWRARRKASQNCGVLATGGAQNSLSRLSGQPSGQENGIYSACGRAQLRLGQVQATPGRADSGAQFFTQWRNRH
jgi:hypothetical protein